jgi:hypothetical protein
MIGRTNGALRADHSTSSTLATTLLARSEIGPAAQAGVPVHGSWPVSRVPRLGLHDRERRQLHPKGKRFLDMARSYLRPCCENKQWPSRGVSRRLDQGRGLHRCRCRKNAPFHNVWPRDQKLKQIGALNLVQWEEGLDGISMVCLNKLPAAAPAWPLEDIQALVAEARADTKNHKYHDQDSL